MTKLATLDQDGNISSPAKIADRLLSYFFASDFSQSTALYGEIKSLPSIIQRNANNPSGVVADIKSDLEALFSPYFESVTFDVEYNNDDGSKYNIRLYGSVIKDEESYVVANLLTITNNKLSSVSELKL